MGNLGDSCVATAGGWCVTHSQSPLRIPIPKPLVKSGGDLVVSAPEGRERPASNTQGVPTSPQGPPKIEGTWVHPALKGCEPPTKPRGASPSPNGPCKTKMIGLYPRFRDCGAPYQIPFGVLIPTPSVKDRGDQRLCATEGVYHWHPKPTGCPYPQTVRLILRGHMCIHRLGLRTTGTRSPRSTLSPHSPSESKGLWVYPTMDGYVPLQITTWCLYPDIVRPKPGQCWCTKCRMVM